MDNQIKKPKFTIADIRIGVGDAEFKKGMDLYKKGALNKLQQVFSGCSAIVSGTHDYNVEVDFSAFDRGFCNCYLGQNDQLCKHMIAVSIAMVHKYRPEDVNELKQSVDGIVCINEIRDITEVEQGNFKEEIKKAFTCLKSYNGPSSKWFRYQHSLVTGARLITLALSKLPICEKSVALCIDLLKRLDKKILTVDDSDGTIGGLMSEAVGLLNLFVEKEPKLKDFIIRKLPKGESFDWESEFKY